MPAQTLPRSVAPHILAAFEAKKKKREAAAAAAAAAGEAPKEAAPEEPAKPLPVRPGKPEVRASKPAPNPQESFRKKLERKKALAEEAAAEALAPQPGFSFPTPAPAPLATPTASAPISEEPAPAPAPTEEPSPSLSAGPVSNEAALVKILEALFAKLDRAEAIALANGRNLQLLTSAVGNMIFGGKKGAAAIVAKIPGATPQPQPTEEPTPNPGEEPKP